MASAALGAKLGIRAAGSTAAFTDIGCLTNIEGPNSSREVIDLTCHDSTGGYRTIDGSFRDAGTVDITYRYSSTSTSHILVHTRYESTGLTGVKITEADSTTSTITFDALITGLGKSRPYDGAMEATATFQISGAATYTTT